MKNQFLAKERELSAKFDYKYNQMDALLKTTLLVMSLFFVSIESTQAKSLSSAKRVRQESAEMVELKKSYYYRSAKKALQEFQKQSFTEGTDDLNVIFYKIEKKVIYQNIKQNEVQHFNFDHLAQAVVNYLQLLKSDMSLSIDSKKRAVMQLHFYGLSQAIKKANEINLSIRSEQFGKLSDMLISNSTSLFYSSYKEIKYTDFFWTSYFLHELGYPMDLTAKHLEILGERVKTFKYPEKYREYGEKLSRLSLGYGQKVSKPTLTELDLLYQWALGVHNDAHIAKIVQKNYLKQLQSLGETEKMKVIKKEIAKNILIEESISFLKNPLRLFKYIQFIFGYIFVAWPLEMILFVVAVAIFSIQSSTTLTPEEAMKAKSFHHRIWLMFTKSYLTSNVPFFSKVAASLVLFGIGLYFRSAANFVESLISGF